MTKRHRPNCMAQPWRDNKEESCNCSIGQERKKKFEELTLSDLCLKLVSAKKNDKNDFPGSCIRIKDHNGKCQKINNGMTESEARAITERDL